MFKKSFESREPEYFEDVSFRRLCMGKDGRSALVLGYEVKLTGAEFTILDALMKSEKYITKAQFETVYGVSRSSVAVHISHVNKKTFPITHRRLIENDGSDAYRISDTV